MLYEVITSDNPMSMSNDPLKSLEYYQSSGLMKESGNENINGVMCTKSILYNKDNPEQEMFAIWYSDRYKFPMKMVNYIDGTEKSGMEISDVKPWTPDPRVFEIPAGFRVMDVPGIPVITSYSIHYTKLYDTWSGDRFNPGIGFEIKDNYQGWRAISQYGWFPGQESPLRYHKIMLTGYTFWNTATRLRETVNTVMTWYRNNFV